MKRVFLFLLLVVTTTTFSQESLQKIDMAIATEKSVRHNLFFVRPQLSLPIVSSHGDYLFEPRVVFGYQFGSQLSIGLGTGVIDKFIMDENFDIKQALYSVPLCFSVRTYFNDGLWSPFAELSGGYCFGINSRIEHVVISDVDYYNNTLIMQGPVFDLTVGVRYKNIDLGFSWNLVGEAIHFERKYIYFNDATQTYEESESNVFYRRSNKYISIMIAYNITL